MEAKKIVEIITKALEEKNAMGIVTLDVTDRSDVTDYFIIASGKNTPMVKALCDNVDEKMTKAGMDSKRREGYMEGRWIVLDFGDVIVHMFHDETRLFYQLERLWE